MRFSVAISLCLGLVVNSPLAAAYVVKPPSEAASDTATGCNVWWVAQEGDGFAHIAALSDISVEMFESLVSFSSVYVFVFHTNIPFFIHHFPCHILTYLILTNTFISTPKTESFYQA